MTMKEIVPQDILRSLLNYDPVTGHFARTNGSKAGSLNKSDGYIYIRLGKYGRFVAHRLAWVYMYGSIDQNEIDHINCIRHDNSISNLRLVNRIQNANNQGRRSDNTSGHVGVQWHSKDKAYRAFITMSGKYTHLGNFETLDEAIIARTEAKQRKDAHYEL